MVQNKRYSRLEELLKQQQWEQADNETYRLMIETAGKTKHQWFDPEDLENFPCGDLRIINQLWFDNSNGKFAFSVQAEIYRSLGGTKEYNGEIWEKFCDCVGWRKKDKGLNYSELDFHTLNLNAPNGNLPAVGGSEYRTGECLGVTVGFVGRLFDEEVRCWRCSLFSRSDLLTGDP